MTDREIVKALEDLVKCNNNEIDCDNCSLSVFYPRCPEEIGELSLDLISCLQAENKRLSTLAELGNTRANDYRVMRDRALKAEAEVERLKKAYLKSQEIFAEQSLENERLKAENERLKKEKDEYAYLYDKHINTAFSYIKAEAYKECIENVKNYIKIHCNPYGKPDFDYDTSIKILNFIDKLAKEMVGDDNA